MAPHITPIFCTPPLWRRSFNIALALGALSIAGVMFTSGVTLADEDRAGSRTPQRSTDSSVSRNIRESYVLLSNGNVLHGETTRLGKYITIARDSSQIRLKAQQVAHIGTSLDNLYQYRISNRIPGDLRQLKHDIRWSLHNGLTRRAAEDVLEARRINAADPEVVHLLRMIAAAMSPQTPPARSPSPVQQASFQQDTETASEPLPENPSNLSERSFHQFITQVQPILINRCASCHSESPQNETGLNLQSAIKATWAPKHTAVKNLDSVMKFVDLQTLEASPLRIRATDGHGGPKKNLGKPGSPMMRRLDSWLIGLVRDPGPNTPSSDTPSPSSSPPSPQPVKTPPALSPIESPMEDGDSPDAQTESSVTPAEKVTSQSPLRRMPTVSNPFDPDLFNRRFHR